MEQEQATMARVTWRLVPLLIAAYLIAYLDRVNVSFAAIRMNADLGLSAAAYGFGAGIFFITYTLFEVPSNIILEKVGARRWIARIMLTWGLVSGAMAFVTGETSFYILRALLGIAEAGFFPGVVFYLSLWFPAGYRGRISSYFMVAIPLSTVIGAPLSGIILGMDGMLGFTGWQWLFIIEAVPAIVLAVIVFWYLTDRPAEAGWLEPDQRNWLQARMDAENKEDAGGHHSIAAALKSPRVLALGLVCFGAVITNYGVSFFLPQIISGFGLSALATGFVAALPYVVGAVGMIWWGRRSDTRGERKIHTAIAIAVAVISLIVSTMLSDPVLKITAISIAGFGMFAYLGPFWAIPNTFLRGPALAAGIAAINSIANVAGFTGPYIVGYVKTLTGSFEGGLLALAGLGCVAIVILLCLPIERTAPLARTKPHPAE
ncbi:MFS transporter [Mesorhizobium sp. B2-2-3]|uniref:MFS transporter n=1 Tax=Mesorhizobium sp. B2-2-3 TaxID=2589963 RepID=UPI00112991A4|nr:MFS transporter [Mesorhizobium sp. B2-2-3]TPM40445.1 MFS transporter [Mesorhizobium sp. B2-2-3]